MIYADHAATTALSPFALAEMQPWLENQYGNPSTLYHFAREPRKAIEHAREVIAIAIGANPEEIFFTSGGTESDNWAIKGIALRNALKKRKVITSKIEHHAVLNSCAFLQRHGFSIDYLNTNVEGIVDQQQLEKLITKSTALVTVMLANNEIGSIQPIRDLAAIAHNAGCVIHTDAVQAVGHIPIDVKNLDVDMLSASAHKFNGPKGVGFLFIKKGIEIEPLLHGGAQETNFRAGTENVAGIVGMATALKEHIDNLNKEMTYLNNLNAILLDKLHSSNLDFRVNGAENRIPGSLSVSFKNIEGEMLLHRLDLMGTAVATGSACDSNNTVLSHVISAIRVPEEYAFGTIRISLGLDNSIEDALTIVEQIKHILG